MSHLILRSFLVICVAFLAAPLSAENHVAQGAFGVTYGNDDCNNDPAFLEENEITCTAVFAETNVWDFLNNLPRRISLETLIALNPSLNIEGYDTILGGITFVRVQ